MHHSFKKITCQNGRMLWWIALTAHVLDFKSSFLKIICLRIVDLVAVIFLPVFNGFAWFFHRLCSFGCTVCNEWTSFSLLWSFILLLWKRASLCQSVIDLMRLKNCFTHCTICNSVNVSRKFHCFMVYVCWDKFAIISEVDLSFPELPWQPVGVVSHLPCQSFKLI